MLSMSFMQIFTFSDRINSYHMMMVAADSTRSSFIGSIVLTIPDSSRWSSRLYLSKVTSRNNRVAKCFTFQQQSQEKDKNITASWTAAKLVTL